MCSNQFYRRLILLFLFALTPAIACATEIQLKQPGDLTLTADYHQGKPGKPTLLLLHGYLQTRNFPLIYNMVNAFKDEGYTVLAPTLSLGISNRSKSLPCEAIHLHSMQDDLREIGLWIDWLIKHGSKDITLVGHSFGAVQLLAYASDKPAAEVKRLMLVSISDVEHKFLSPGRVDKSAAVKLAQKDKNAMGNFELGFCLKYYSNATAYLSYTAWTQERVLKSLKQIKIPSNLIFGDGDAVVSKDWPLRTKNAGASVTIIPNSTHFFEDSNSEYELIETIRILTSSRSGIHQQ